MDLMAPAERDELLDTFERDAFHLELREHYQAANEAGPFARWRNRQPDDLRWTVPWLDRVRAAVSTGKVVRRVRVVTEPLAEYFRWLHELTKLNQEAGEDIRWLPRHRLPKDLDLPVGGNDFWIFDDRLVTVGHFDNDGRILGSELVTDPATVAACARTRDTLWPIATPHSGYRPI
jgi:hypothetical protein